MTRPTSPDGADRQIRKNQLLRARKASPHKKLDDGKNKKLEVI